MAVFEQLNSLALATRLKLLSESLAKDVANVYRLLNIGFEPRWLTLFCTLKSRHTLTITELARELRQTHAAAVQLTNLLEKKGLVVSTKNMNDERRRQVSLSPAGLKLFDQVEPVLHAIEQANSDLLLLSAPDFIGSLEAIEHALDQKSMHDRILENLGLLNQGITIKAYSPEYKDSFYDLNEAWMEEYLGSISMQEQAVWEQPEKHILQQGGMIFFAVYNQKAVGTAALQPLEDSTTYQVSHFTVENKLRGRGIGKALFEQLRAYSQSKRASSLIAYTNPTLVEAVNFFIKKGFYLAPLQQEDSPFYQAPTLKLVHSLQG